jgi:hypothetical protein
MIAVGAIVFAAALTTAAVYFLTYGSRRPANQRRGGSAGRCAGASARHGHRQA